MQLCHPWATSCVVHVCVLLQVWLTSRDLSGNVGEAIVTLTVDTPDVLGPVFVEDTPEPSRPTATPAGSETVTVDLALNEPGTATCVLEECFVPFDEGLCDAEVVPAVTDVLGGATARTAVSSFVALPVADTVVSLSLTVGLVRSHL